MLDGKLRPPGSELLHQDQQDQREREPANEPAECLGRDMGHQQPAANDSDESGRNHLQHENSLCVRAIGVNGKDVSENEHGENGAGGLSRRENACHDENGQHSQSTKAGFGHPNRNCREDRKGPLERGKIVHPQTNRAKQACRWKQHSVEILCLAGLLCGNCATL